MKNQSLLVLAALLLAFALGYAFTFQVNYHESAIVTYWGKADASSVVNAADADEAGLHFFVPIWMGVEKFDKRTQILETRLEEQQTADAQNVVLSVYLTWRIEDPLAFYRSLNDVRTAEDQIRDRLRDARSVLGQYSLTQLTTTEPGKQKLAEAEKKILDRLNTGQTAGADQGLAFLEVGIKRIVLTEEVAAKVFERMTATRARKAERASSEGKAAAEDIMARAASDKERIMAFARRRAQAIRAEGDAAAAKYYAVFKEDESFAIYLRKLEAYKVILKNNTTFLLDAKDGLGQEFLQTPKQR